MGGVDVRTVVNGAGFLPPIDVTYLAGNFGATAAMTWTVDLADQVSFVYAKSGKMMWIGIRLLNTTIGGVVAGANLTIKIPEGKLARNDLAIPFLASPGGGATEGAIAFVAAGSNLITLLRYSANWIAGANNTDVNGTLQFEVQ